MIDITERQHFYKPGINKRFIWGITLVSAMGGLLFGFDWVVIGGAKPFYERFFDIAGNPGLQGWAMSSALVGCLFGASLSGAITNSLGRKIPLLIAAALFTISALGTGAFNHYTAFIIFRIIGGFGIGITSAISPMYIAEISPSSIRGSLVSINQLTIVIGILAAQITNYLIADAVPVSFTDLDIVNSWNGQSGWRWMFWAEIIPATLFFGLTFLIPESPRYLIKAGSDNQALKILKRIGGTEYALSELESIKGSLMEKLGKTNFKELLQKKYRSVLMLGIVLAIFQQWCGINVIFNYAEEVFSSAGYSVSDILFNIVITGTVNLIFTIIAIKLVDRWGRRLLMIIGSSGLAVTYLILGGCYYFEIKGLIVLLLVISAIAIYAFTLAPIIWVVLSEIFPNRIRGAAMALGTSALWIACFILTYTFPLLNKALNASGTFWLYGLICVAGFLFVYKNLPETKGKSLEEVEKLLVK